jgi:hypothetical protein
MDPMSEYLARATINQRLASARELQRGLPLEEERRAERRRRRRQLFARWWRSWVENGQQVGARRLAAAAPSPARPPSVELAQLLEEAAHHIAERGTGSERRLLEAMSEVAAPSAPGAAAALVDRDGAEAARLRAFGQVHGHLMEALGPREHARLLDLLQDAGGVERTRRVA